jgi:hypothetical protein
MARQIEPKGGRCAEGTCCTAAAGKQPKPGPTASSPGPCRPAPASVALRLRRPAN